MRPMGDHENINLAPRGRFFSVRRHPERSRETPVRPGPASFGMTVSSRWRFGPMRRPDKCFHLVQRTDRSTLNTMPLLKRINPRWLIVLIPLIPIAAAAQPSMKAIVVHSYGGPEV